MEKEENVGLDNYLNCMAALVFEKIIKPTNVLVEQIKEEAKLWSLASSGHFIFYYSAGKGTLFK